MWRNPFSVLWGVLLATSLSACSQLNQFRDPEWSFWGYGRITEAGAVSSIPAKFERVDLAELIRKHTKSGASARDDTANLTCLNIEKDVPSWDNFWSYPTDTPEDQCALERLYDAYAKFYDAYGKPESSKLENGDPQGQTPGPKAPESTTNNPKPGEGESRRNAIQAEIMRASNQRCGVYETHLRRLQSNTGFILGSAATALGGLGSIFTAADTARALAGSAGITSGINAEFQENFFSSVIAPVIINGINKRRERFQNALPEKTKKNLADYPLPAAVADAVKYAAACNVSEGIAEVQKDGLVSALVQEGVGFEGMKKTYREIRDIQSLSEASGRQENTPRDALNRLKKDGQSYVDRFTEAVKAKIAEKPGSDLEKALKGKQKDLETAVTSLQTRFTNIVKKFDDCDISEKFTEKINALHSDRKFATSQEEKDKIDRDLAKLFEKAEKFIVRKLGKIDSELRNGIENSQKVITDLDPTKKDQEVKDEAEKAKGLLTEALKDGTINVECKE